MNEEARNGSITWGGLVKVSFRGVTGGGLCCAVRVVRVVSCVMYHCSQFEKGRMIEMREGGKSVGQIAEDLGRSTKTIRKWFARFDEEGEDGMKQRPKSGRPRTTSAEQDQAMVEVNATL